MKIRRSTLAFFSASAFALLSVGCASSGDDHPAPPPIPPVTSPSISVNPALNPILPPTDTASVQSTPIPVYNQATVRKVTLDAYVDANGNAYEPQTKYVVVNQGGWNLDALRAPNQAYVPAENTPPVPTAQGASDSPVVSPGPGSIYDSAPGAGDAKTAAAGSSSSVLFAMDNIRITGFVEKSQGKEANALVKPGETLLYDATLGYIIVPSAVLERENAIPPPGSPIVQPNPPVAASSTPPAPRPVTADYIPAVNTATSAPTPTR
jgi:hypothetical protein